MVYSSRHLSLAFLEILVHVELTGDLPDDRRYWELELPDDAVQELDPDRLGPDWRGSLAHTRALGDAWLDAGRSAGLLVPSAVVPIERNLLLNPGHARIGELDARPTAADRAGSPPRAGRRRSSS